MTGAELGGPAGRAVRCGRVWRVWPAVAGVGEGPAGRAAGCGRTAAAAAVSVANVKLALRCCVQTTDTYIAQMEARD